MENQCNKVENTNNLLTNGGFAPSCSSSLKYIFKRILPLKHIFLQPLVYTEVNITNKKIYLKSTLRNL